MHRYKKQQYISTQDAMAELGNINGQQTTKNLKSTIHEAKLFNYYRRRLMDVIVSHRTLYSILCLKRE